MSSHAIENPAAFRDYYGPWALIGGASDGTGEQFARQLAATGINCALVSRRKEALDALSINLQQDYGIETRVIVQDLAEAGAGLALVDAVADLEVGFYVANAGGGSGGILFVDRPLSDWNRVIHMNVHTPTEVCHGLLPAMLKRGRGGIVLMGSGTGISGTARASVYSASKGYSLNLAESLWIDYNAQGIDVINILAPVMDTPSLRRVAGDRVDAGLIPDVFDPAKAVRLALEELPKGPCLTFPAGPEKENWREVMAARRARVEATGTAVAGVFAKKG